MENKILFLDFDGVLFDTLKEVYLVNRKEYLGIDFFDEIDEEEYALYSKYKFLVYNIWMFYYFNPLIFDKIEEKEIIKQYFDLISNRNLKEEEMFCERFLALRQNLVRNHFDFWKNLETPYDFFFFIKELFERKNIKIVVISKKNKNAILDRFKSYDFNLSPDDVYAREILANYSSKGEFMEEYMAKYGFNEGIFVDDNSNNLNTNKNPKVENVLALWGNAEPNSEGYTQQQAIEKIKNYFI